MDTMTTGTTEPAAKNRSRKVLAALSGLALLGAGGGNLVAAWSDSETAASGTITSGELGINVIGTPSTWDVTPGRANATGNAPVTGSLGHAVDLANWLVIPGDVAEIAVDGDIVLVGDHLKGKLTVDIETASGQLLSASAAEEAGIHLTYVVYDQAGNPLTNVAGTRVGTPSTDLMFRSSINDSAEDAALVEATANGVKDISVVIRAEFDTRTAGTDRMNATADLGSIKLTLDQA